MTGNGGRPPEEKTAKRRPTDDVRAALRLFPGAPARTDTTITNNFNNP